MERLVSKQIVEVLPHLNSDNLEIIKLGTTQLVARKGTYQSGDTVIVIPAKAILPAGPLQDEFKSYLTGPNKDRVSAVRLRGEYSAGVTWPLTEEAIIQLELTPEVEASVIDAPLGQDLSEALGITFYEPPIPPALAGKVSNFPGIGDTRYAHHDCLHLATYRDQLNPDERVVVTEKLHGSQFNYIQTLTTDPENDQDQVVTEYVSSKGILGRGQHILEEGGNTYWQAARNDDLKTLAAILHWWGVVQTGARHRVIQLIGEVVPVQSGFSYGQVRPTVRLYDVMFDGQFVPYDLLPEAVRRLWVPVLYDGPLSGVDVQELCKGKETVSGRALHIREGVVLRPYDSTRRARDGTRLHLKVINPKYKDSDDEIN